MAIWCGIGGCLHHCHHATRWLQVAFKKFTFSKKKPHLNGFIIVIRLLVVIHDQEGVDSEQRELQRVVAQ